MKKPTYEPHQCTECGQTTTYLLGIDKGTIEIVKAIAIAIQRKGINTIHPKKEMEYAQRQVPKDRVAPGFLTSNQIGNISRARFHGLVASVEENRGNYCLTQKGLHFLRGAEIPKYAIISKAEGKQIGYFEPEEFTININSFEGEYWEGINYEIREGHIVYDKPTQTTLV